MARQSLRQSIRKGIIFFLLISILIPLSAEEAVLFPLKDIGITGYGGPHYRMTFIDGNFALFGGGPIMFSLTPEFMLGLTGSYLEFDYNGIMIGYGGIKALYCFFPESLFNIYVGSTVGLGGLTDSQSGTGMFVMEPELQAGIHILPSLELALGVSYRFAFPFEDFGGLGTEELSDVAFICQLKYGNFDNAASIIQGNTTPDGARETFISLSGAYDCTFTLIQGNIVRLDGGTTRLLIGDHLALGLAGCISDPLNYIDFNTHTLYMAESGIWIEYNFNPHDMVQFSIGGPIGVALLNVYEKSSDTSTRYIKFLCNPELFVSIQLFEFCLLTLGAGYQLIIDDIPDIGNISGPSMSIQVRFEG